MITLRKKYILILLVFVILTSLIASFLHNPIVTMADGAMSGTPWGSGTTGNIILTKQTVLRIGFDKRELGEYRDQGYKNCYPRMHQGYSIILGTCGNSYTGSSYTNNVILGPLGDNSGRIDYIKAENMFLTRPSDSGLYQAIWDLTMGGTNNYTGDGVTALTNGKTINLDASLGSELADEIRLISGSDWNTAKFHEDIDWNIPLNQNAKMKDNAMAMVLIATYLNWRGSDIDIKEIYSYYTRQGAKNDYILVLENFHGAMRSSDKQPFFTHQNYIFDVVTGYHVHNTMRAGTVADWYNSVKDIQTKPVNTTYVNGNLTELYATGNANNPTRQLFCQFFASKNGTLAGNRMALSAYFYRRSMLNEDLSQETRDKLPKDSPLLYWYTEQYKDHIALGDSWANDFTRYKTGFAVFKAVPPVTEMPGQPDLEKPKGGHTLTATPITQQVERFTKLSEKAETVKIDITLTPTDNDLISLANTVYKLLYNWTTFKDGSFIIYDQNYTASNLGDRRLIFKSADWILNFKGNEIIESTSTFEDDKGKDSIGKSSLSGRTYLGKTHSSGNMENNDLIIYRSEISGNNKEEKIESIKTLLAEKLSNYSLSKYIPEKYITMHDGKFDLLGTFIWNFDSKLDVNIELEDQFQFVCEGGNLEDYDKNKEVIYKFTDDEGNTKEEKVKVKRIELKDNILYTDWLRSRAVYYYPDNTSKPVQLSESGMYPVDFGESNTIATFNVIENPNKTYRWKNNPKGFAEVKQGSYTDNRNTEGWEVMQGLPTTENLYVNIGGSPYYIDIIADYKTVDFSKNFLMPYSTTSHHTDEHGGIEHELSEENYDKATKKFSASYFVINNITLRPCDKAVLTPNKTLFENGETIEVDFMNDLTAKVIIDSKCGDYYIDNYGDNEDKYAYGITEVLESTLIKEFDKFIQNCTKCDSETEKHKEHFNAELNKHKVFVNTPGVILEVYNGNELLNSLEILKPYSYSAPILEIESNNLISSTELWQPQKWNNEYDIIPFQGYTGQPNLETGRNKNNKFYGETDILINIESQNGRYEIPSKSVNENYNDEIKAGYESDVNKYVTYLNLGEAQEFGPGICINNVSTPDEYPIPINYTDDLKHPDEPKGINPIIVHNPVTIQDVSMGTSSLTEQRIGYKNPLGQTGAIVRLDINDYFNVYTPTDGALIRNYELETSNAGSTNKNITDYLNRGLLISEMYKVKQSEKELSEAASGALGKGYNGLTSDILNPVPALNSIRNSGNYMDTKKWTSYKFIQFPFSVIINPDSNAEYISPNTWISIPVSNTVTKFVVAGMQKDLNAVNVKFVAIACNAPDINSFKDNISSDNVLQITNAEISGLITNAYNKSNASVNYSRESNNIANHYVNNNFVVDVVGRIGNFTVDYCDDPAISEQFNNNYIRSKYNMYDEERGVLNLSGTLSTHALSKAIGNLPLKSIHTNDNIDVIPKLGYGINYSLQTIGDYGDEGKKLTIIPSYEIDEEEVTSIDYLFDSKTLEKIYDVGTNSVSYQLLNSINSLKAKINLVKSDVYETGDVLSWNENNPIGVKVNQNGGIQIGSNINQVIQGTPSYIILPTNLRTFIGYTARSQQNNETLAFKIDNKNDNSFIKEFNINHHRWCGQFSLPSSSKFYINNEKQSVDMLNKSVLVNFKITTDLSSAGWALQATNNVPQSQIDEPEYLIPVVEFDLSETSASDMSIIGTH